MLFLIDAGGVVNQVTKSGSNEYHGQLFYYLRNNRFGARNPLGFQNVLVNGVVELLPEVLVVGSLEELGDRP